MVEKNKKGFFEKLFGGGCNCGSFELQEEDREETKTDQTENPEKSNSLSGKEDQAPNIITSKKSGPKSGGGC